MSVCSTPSLVRHAYKRTARQTRWISFLRFSCALRIEEIHSMRFVSLLTKSLALNCLSLLQCSFVSWIIEIHTFVISESGELMFDFGTLKIQIHIPFFHYMCI